ncbi:MAG: hypothetical protein ACR2ND_02540 [Solirubrobacteraceae bacterium]
MWLVNGYPTFAAGEEKTQVDLPAGYGFRYLPSDKWLLNDMVHNLFPNPDAVYITYDIDFVPDSAAAAKAIKTVRTQSMMSKGSRRASRLHRGQQPGQMEYPWRRETAKVAPFRHRVAHERRCRLAGNGRSATTAVWR